MDDFTKTKLINNLIDLVSHFYEQKHKMSDRAKIKYLKGFCEGIAHTLVGLSILSEEEAVTILKGLGKKRQVSKREENLDIPTIFRKQKSDKKVVGE